MECMYEEIVHEITSSNWRKGAQKERSKEPSTEKILAKDVRILM